MQTSSFTVLIAAILTGCATPELPLSGDAVQVHELHCNPDQTVVATGSMRIPGELLNTQGILLYSPNGGLTFSIKASSRDLVGITPRFFTDPRERSGANRPLVVTGYNSQSGFWTYQLGGWKQSDNSGLTWTTIAARLPDVGSRDPLGHPPPLVVIDRSRRLATLRKAPSPALLISDDHGRTWGETRLPGILGLDDLRTDGQGRLIAVGWTTSLLKGLGAFRTVVMQSDDSGKTWSVAVDEVGTAPCKPSIIGSPDGPMFLNYGCGADRLYFVSADGGRTWNARRLNGYAYGPFELVAELGDKRLLAISQDGKSLVAWTSDDGGGEWHQHPTGFSFLSGRGDLQRHSIVVLSGGVVLAYIGDGQVLRSADRGESWTLIDTGLSSQGNYSLNASCTDGHKFVVLGGGGGTLIRSRDGGLTWERGRIH